MGLLATSTQAIESTQHNAIFYSSCQTLVGVHEKLEGLTQQVLHEALI